MFGEGKEFCSMVLRNAQQMRKGGKMLAVAPRHVFLQPVKCAREVFSSSRELVLDVKSVEASEVFSSVSVVASVDCVVVAHDDNSTMKPTIVMSFIEDVIFTMAYSSESNAVRL